MSICVKLNHKQRRKLWKKEKRKKKRIQSCMERLKHCREQDSECETKEEEKSKTLPAGELTNYAIICYLKKVAEENTKQNTAHLSQNVNYNGVVDNHSGASETLDVLVEIHGDNPSNHSLLSSESATVGSPGVMQPGELENRVDLPDNEQDVNAEKEEVTKSEKDEMKDLLSLLDEEVEQWQNPPAPDVEEVIRLPPPPPVAPPVVSEENKPICIFFAKVGACRFSDRCSRRHEEPERSNVLLFPNMFHTFAFDIEERSNKQGGDDHGISLEHSDQDLQSEFLDFHSDVVPEFQQVGTVRELYVCCNRVKHLRGNVYVQYEDAETAQKCFDKMYGRFYNGKQLFCKFVTIQSWGGSICGTHQRSKNCSRGGNCNFLHVFANPSAGRDNRHIHRRHRNDEQKRAHDRWRGYGHRRYSPYYKHGKRRRSRSRTPPSCVTFNRADSGEKVRWEEKNSKATGPRKHKKQKKSRSKDRRRQKSRSHSPCDSSPNSPTNIERENISSKRKLENSKSRSVSPKEKYVQDTERKSTKKKSKKKKKKEKLKKEKSRNKSIESSPRS